MNFGEYIQSFRIKHVISLKKAAGLLDISASYLSGIEKGFRSAPSVDLLNKMADVYELNHRERLRLFDLAAESKQPPTIADDVIEYIVEHPVIRDMLRYSMECRLTDKDWEKVFTFVKKNYFY